MLRFVGDPIRFLFRKTVVGARLQEFEKPGTRCAIHRLEFLDGNQGSQGLALSLDDELVVAQGDPVQVVAELFPDFQRGDSFCHDGNYNIYGVS